MVQIKQRRTVVKTSVLRTMNFKRLFTSVVCLGLMLLTAEVFAKDVITLGNMATSVTDTFSSIGKLITGGSYLAGLGFSIAAIMKFKQHKDNPTQITIGTPIALVLIAAALLFLPSILDVTGYTMFGKQGGMTAGPSGMNYSGTSKGTQ